MMLDASGKPPLIQSQIEAFNESQGSEKCANREHRYRGGPPPRRIKRMQIAHEVRARQAGVPWDLVDLRLVYAHWKGLCGICHHPVGYEEFTIDHIVPISKGGPHVFENLQPAHRRCNSHKRDRLTTEPISVRLPVSTYERLYEYARVTNSSVTNVIKAAIEQQLVTERRNAAR